MEVKKIVEGMTAPQVAQVIDDNFKAQNRILKEDIAKQNNVVGVSEYKDFSEAEAVNVGDVRKYNGFLYECVEATSGAFDASKWKKSSFKAETEKKLSELGLEVNKKISELKTDVIESDANESDLNISDESGNILAEFSNGHIRTKNFDSKEMPGFSETDNDLEFSDESGNILAEFSNGHIRTKNFDSKEMPGFSETDNDLEFSDESGNILAEFSNGHIRTKNFDSANIKVNSNDVIESTLKGKKISILGDSISTCIENNAVEFTFLSSDVGKTLQGYPTYYDIGTTIGGKTVTSAMVGTLTSFNPTSDDVGKVIGTPLNYNDLPQSQLWWGILAAKTGAEILQNVSWSGASISSHESSQEKYKASYAWHDAQINKLADRDTNGAVIVPDIVIIYRGTNDMTHAPYTLITDFGEKTTAIPTTDMVDSGYGFKEAYCMTIKKIREKYPNTLVVCCTLNVFKRVNYSQFPTNNGLNTLPEYNNAIREVANYMGCGLIEFDKDGITFENCYPTYISDSASIPTHPNAIGHKKMAEKAYKDIINI